MSVNKLKETIKEMYNLGLNDCKEFQDLSERLKSTNLGDNKITEEQIECVSKQIEEYKTSVEQLREDIKLAPGDFKATLNAVLLASKPGQKESKIKPTELEEKYQVFLKDRSRLKEELKNLRTEHIEQMLNDPSLDEEAKLSYELEKEFISIMPFFESLRHGVSKHLMEYCNTSADFLLEKHYLDRNFFRREKPSLGLERFDKFEYQIKVEQERRKKMKQKVFINKLFAVNKEFIEFHKKKSKVLRKNAMNARGFLEALKKKDQQEIDVEERERLEAIKAQKFEVYKDLLKKAKNKRILEILEETDQFLKDIGLKVIETKGERALEDLKNKVKEGEEYDVNKSALLQENYNKMYYNLTHSNLEDIKEQPSLLEGGKLKSYQMAGLRWMISLYNNKLNGILADEMGLGKTIQTIALFCYLMEHKQNFGPFLVIVPLSTLSNWKLEFEKWAPSIKKIIYKGSPQQRKEIAKYLKNNKSNVCLTTYEFVMKDKTDLNKFHWQYIVVDEGHKMKNPKSKFAYTLGFQYNSEHRLLLTGTPLQNNLTELWSLLNFLLPKVFASAEDFEKWFKLPMKRMGAEKEVDLNEEEKLLIVHRFHQVLRPFLLRRIKKDVESELPKKMEYIIKVELSAWQKVVYNQISQRESSNMLNNPGKYNSFMMNNMLMQLRKICNHPYLFLDYYTESEELIRCAGKFELLDRMIPKLIKTGHRMLIFTQMTSVIDLLEVFFHYRGIKFLRLDGTTKHEERAERMLQFNAKNSEIPVFLLSTKAGGLGLNLQTADTVILFDSDWNPAIDEQAQDRAHRIGTLKEVRVFRFVTQSTIEEQILLKASYKKGLDEMVIQAGLYNNKATDLERRERLEEVIKKQNLDREDEEEIPNDEEINKIMSRDDDEFELFQELDKLRYDQEKKYYSNFNPEINYRLTTYEEIPEWIRELEEYKKEDDLLEKRRRPKIWDLDRLKDDDSIDEEVKKAKRERTKKTKEKQDVEGENGTIEIKNKQEDEIFIDSDN